MITAVYASIRQHPTESLSQRVERICSGIVTTLISARHASTPLIRPPTPSKWHSDPRIKDSAIKTRRAKRKAERTRQSEAKIEYHRQICETRQTISDVLNEKRERFLKTAAKSTSSAWKLIEILKPKSIVQPTTIPDTKTRKPPKSPAESLNNLATYFSGTIFSNEMSANDHYERIEDWSWNAQQPHTPFTAADARSAVSQLCNDTSPGNDSFATPFLKHASDRMMGLISTLANLSIQSSHWPSMWRINRAVALFKKGDHSDPANYRIITISSVISRTVERMIYPRLLSQLGNDFFHRFQSGFRGKRSVNDNLYMLTESIQIGMSKQSAKGYPVAFLDIKKAFDSVCHKRLIDKCKKAGISNVYCDWIASFSRDRQFYLDQQSIRSTPKPAAFGVPQGSIISPLLFLIFINDMSDTAYWPTNMRLLLFADDVAVLPDINTSCQRWIPSMNDALQQIHLWGIKI